MQNCQIFTADDNGRGDETGVHVLDGSSLLRGIDDFDDKQPSMARSAGLCRHLSPLLPFSLSSRSRSARVKRSNARRLVSFWNAAALFNAIQRENRREASFFPASIFISRVNTSRCAAAARNLRTKKADAVFSFFFCLVFFSPSLHFYCRAGQWPFTWRGQ